ncbi:MAG: DUF1513 domain-containing protein [Chromatiales bacterium]|nr:DUF1513 domain-containing protein [Chromatiales bacterium]
MAIDRRAFIRLGLGGLLLGPAMAMAGTGAGRQRLLGCRSDDRGGHFLSMVDVDGGRLMDVALPGRGHGVAVDPMQRRAAVFARRPGTFVWIVDLASGQVSHRIAAVSGRHFYGHGQFTPDGTRLLCSENAYASGEGVIGVYDAGNSYRRADELPSHGVGPHEIRLLADGNTLVIANGGIRTHPDLPRVKSNLAGMRPNLAYVDVASGRLLQRHEPEEQWHQLSIRHIDVSPDDRVAVAMQFEGRPELFPPLIAIQHGKQPMRLLSAPDAVQRRLRNYCGSVTFDAEGLRFAVSSPRGGVVTFWSAGGDYLGLYEQADACGIGRTAADGYGFVVSDGNGGVAGIDRVLAVSDHRVFAGYRWDNHLLALSDLQGR